MECLLKNVPIYTEKLRTSQAVLLLISLLLFLFGIVYLFLEVKLFLDVKKYE